MVCERLSINLCIACGLLLAGCAARTADHGHGTVYWVLGGSISGGTIVGQQQRLVQNNLFQNRDCPVLNDYRSVLGGLFRTLWGLSPAQSSRVFAQTSLIDLKLV